MKNLSYILLLLMASVAGASTYYVTQAAAGGGAGTEGDPFTLEEACDNVAAGDIVYVKADSDYTAEYDTGGAKSCVAYFTTSGTYGQYISFIGYKTAITDGGVVTLDAGPNALVNAASSDGTADFYRFENFVFKNASSEGFNCSGNDQSVFKFCSFEHNDDQGAFGGYNSTFVGCRFHHNGEEGIETTGDYTRFFGCQVYYNNWSGLLKTGQFLFVADCDFWNNAYWDIQTKQKEGMVINCNFFSDSNAAGAIYFQSPNVYYSAIVANCTFSDYTGYPSAGYDNAIHRTGGSTFYLPVFACMFDNCDYDVNGFSATPVDGDGVGDWGTDTTTADPNWRNPHAGNFRLGASNNTKGKGWDKGKSKDFWDDVGNGTNPPTVPDGGMSPGAGQQTPIVAGGGWWRVWNKMGWKDNNKKGNKQ